MNGSKQQQQALGGTALTPPNREQHQCSLSVASQFGRDIVILANEWVTQVVYPHLARCVSPFLHHQLAGVSESEALQG